MLFEDREKVRALLSSGYDLTYIKDYLNKKNAPYRNKPLYQTHDVWEAIREHDLDRSDRIRIPFRDYEIDIRKDKEHERGNRGKHPKAS